MKKVLSFILFVMFASTLNAQMFDFAQEQPQDEQIDQSLKSIFLSYENVPRTVYVGEVFPIKIKAIVTRNDYKKIVTNVKNSNDFRVLNLKNEWEKDIDTQYFTNTLYLQAIKKSSKLPDLIVELINEYGVLEQDEIEGEAISTIKVNGDNKFSGVVAQSLTIKNESTNRFDDKLLIVTLEMEATYSNLKEFKLPTQSNGSVGVFREDVVLQYIEYDIIVPDYTQEIEFTYFNIASNSFELIKVPLHIKSDDVSTHTDLNPKENKFKLYKDILLAVLCVLMLIVFVFKRYKILIVAAIFIVAYLLYENNPYNKITILSNTTIRVLPTEKSSIFHITEGFVEAERLMSKNGYVKVMLPSGRIGWIKEKDGAKN